MIIAIPAAASKNLMVLLESILADATIDSPQGRTRDGSIACTFKVGNLSHRAAEYGWFIRISKVIRLEI